MISVFTPDKDVTKFYLEKEVPSAEEEHTAGQGSQGRLLAPITKEMLLDYVSCEGEIKIIMLKKINL